MQCPSLVRRAITASAARRARAASSRVSPPPERQPAQWRSYACHANAGCVLEVTARTSHHGLAPKERGLSPVQCHYIVRSTITTSAARRARAASSRVSPPPERQPAQWRLRACHANAGCVLEVTARTSHHGLAPKERGLPPVQYPLKVRKPTTASAARRARAASSRVFATSRETASAVALARATRKPAACWRPQLARRTTVLHRKREAFRRCSAFLVRKPITDQRGTARARGKLACFATSRETASAVALARATRMPAACWRPQLARRTTVLHRRREAFRRCSAILCA